MTRWRCTSCGTVWEDDEVQQVQPDGQVACPFEQCGTGTLVDDRVDGIVELLGGDEPDFSPFADMLEAGDVPTFGFRVLVRIGDDGEMHTDHGFVGEKVQGYLLLGAVIGAAIETFHDHLHGEHP